jgi:hypothetical protein
MKHRALLSACLIATLATGVALAQPSAVQTSAQPAASTSPVAYVYISRDDPNYVDAFAASASGTLTLLGGVSSPATLTHLTVTKKYLFGIDNGSNIYSYSIASNGTLKEVATTAAGKYIPDFSSTTSVSLLQTDETGSSLYAFLADTSQNYYLVSFKIESNGTLEYLGKAFANSFVSQIRFVQNNQFAVYPACVTTSENSTEVTFYAATLVYRRESNGYLTYVDTNLDAPEAKSPNQYCPEAAAGDPTDHLAVGYGTIVPSQNEIVGFALGTYTVSSQGKPSTTSDYENMPATGFAPAAMSISPSGAVLAVGGSEEYQFFHYNGGNPIKTYAGPFNAGDQVRSLAWDKSNHLYMLTGSSVVPFNLTPTSYKELTPYPVLGPYSMIVLSLQ